MDDLTPWELEQWWMVNKMRLLDIIRQTTRYGGEFSATNFARDLHKKKKKKKKKKKTMAKAMKKMREVGPEVEAPSEVASTSPSERMVW